MKLDVLELNKLSDSSLNSVSKERSGLDTRFQSFFLKEYRDEIERYLAGNQESISEVYGNLSAMMNFNFFYPLWKEKKLGVLNDFLCLDIDPHQAEFEKKYSDGHKINLLLQGDFQKVYFLIRYLESDFGTKNFLGSKTRESVHSFHSDFQLTVQDSFSRLSKDEFYRYYQLFSTFLPVVSNENRDVVFVLFPRKNMKLENDFQRFMAILNNKLKYKVMAYKIRRLYWEDLADYVLTRIEKNHRLYDHIENLLETYL